MRKLVAFCLCVCVIISLSVCVFAGVDYTLGFRTHSISAAKKEEFLKVAKLELIDSDSRGGSIHCFDVSPNGYFVVGIGSSSNSTLYVYNLSGEFQFGYRFNSVGDYRTGFKEENLAIYFLRDNYIVILDAQGNCIDIQAIVNPYASYQITQEIVGRTSKTVGGKEYRLERAMNFGPGYSKLVVCDGTAEERILYDASAENMAVQIFLILLFIGFATFVVTFFYFLACHVRNSEKEGVWYCQALQIQISFDDPRDSYILENGEKIRCRCDTFHGGSTLAVTCQELEHPIYELGKTLFAAEIKYFDDSTMKVSPKNTNAEFIFIRTDLS